MELMKKSVGIIGNSGRMGSLISQAIQQEGLYDLGIGFNHGSTNKLDSVFLENDFIIDFSSHKLISDTIATLSMYPKPIAICTTGWDFEQYKRDLEKIALAAPILIASNTSLGANVQRYLTTILSQVLDSSYDIDINEKHHRNKIDIPSGTTNSLLKDIQQIKQLYFNCNYETYHLDHGPRPMNFIGVHAERTGNIFCEHNVTFTSNNESISIKHTAFNRELFVDGVLKIIKWFDQEKPKPHIYSMFDILKFK